MKISLIVEGKTEKAFIPKLREHLQTLLPGKMPNLHSVPQNGRVPRGDKLDKLVNGLLHNGENPADHVIALNRRLPRLYRRCRGQVQHTSICQKSGTFPCSRGAVRI
jgi:hypothetical protein